MHTATNIPDAIDQFEREIAQYALQGLAYVRVIHGIGAGVLRKKVESIVSTHPLVVDYKRDIHGGSTIILL